jgi:hypothetical protein
MAIEVAVQRPEIGDVVDIERTETSVRGTPKGTPLFACVVGGVARRAG